LRFSVLICVVSLALQSPALLNIHNRCQDIHLTSPVYFTRGEKWHIVPDQEINADAVMVNHLEFDSGRDILEGILTYRLRRHVKSDKLIESKNIQLLVAWYGGYTEGLHVRALLVEHDKEFNWDEGKLRRLHQKYWHLLDVLDNTTGIGWLLSDATMLATTVKAMNSKYRWDIFISEGGQDNYVMKPFWIDAER
jgi:hypothetical protein